MKRSLFLIITLIITAFASKAALTADWRIHQTFDAWPISIYETPNRVYFASRTFEYNKYASGRNINSYVVHFYDKQGDEVRTVNSIDGASGNAVECLSYNPEKGYLLVVYTDQNIDFIYDDGRIFNVPALMASSIPGKKNINAISFDAPNNNVYLATAFGYVVLNDKKYEVAESRNYGESLTGATRAGDRIAIVRESDRQIYTAPASQQRYNISDYSLIPGAKVTSELIPLADGSFLAILLGTGGHVVKYTPSSSDYNVNVVRTEDYIYNYQYAPDGYALATKKGILKFSKDGSLNFAEERPEAEWQLPGTCIDNKNLWGLKGRSGLRHYRRDNNSWTLVADYMRPHSPATYISTSSVYHPTYGLLAGSVGMDNFYFDTNQNTPANISALKDGFWKEYSPLYTNPSFSELRNFSGLSVDPNDPKYVYRNSLIGGIMRVNLDNPDDVMIFANPANSYSGYKGFVEVFPDQNAWNILCKVTTPQFDNYGTMWTAYNNIDKNEFHLYYWNAADRRATVSKQTYRPLKSFKINNVTPTNTDIMVALKAGPNKNLLAIGNQYDYGRVYIYDHNGTPDTKSDDRLADIHFPYDQDGGSVRFLVINGLVEDPETGLLWILSERGLFTLNPATAFDNPNSINRIKVARNDGTNLADYLLNEVNVYSMCIDGEGRKWFGTANGLVCTSADGKTILAEFTPENSKLPCDDIYSVCYNPENRSVMLGTDVGLVEIFPSGSGMGADADQGVRIYPNPVEPDFYGWVRIDNVADGSLVKITDSTGGIVKELGPAQGGAVEWDITGFNNRRVSTGVYYVMVSPGNAGGKASINKILVLN